MEVFLLLRKMFPREALIDWKAKPKNIGVIHNAQPI
jgi:hypothetical protein